MDSHGKADTRGELFVGPPPEEWRRLPEIAGLWTISSGGFVKWASISTPMFLDGFASEGTQQIWPFAQLPGPGLFVVQGFQDLRRDRILLFFRENLDSAQSLLEQACHNFKVAQFRACPLYCLKGAFFVPRRRSVRATRQAHRGN
jgi:hypothetical protein